MGKLRTMNGGVRNTKFWSGILKGRDYSECLGVGGRINIKSDLKLVV
jgi:hypothetical protein